MGILISQSKRGGNCLDQSEERRELKKRDFKNVKVILLRKLTDLFGGVTVHLLRLEFYLKMC